MEEALFWLWGENVAGIPTAEKKGKSITKEGEYLLGKGVRVR